jgi:murein DD-endopeptidase MepM/ murein hydrolase activator NlpD
MLRFSEVKNLSVVRERCLSAAIVPGAMVGLAVLLSGCSAELLRFDAPAFNLNGDKSAAKTNTAAAPAGETFDDPDLAPASVARVDRNSPPPSNGRATKPERRIASLPAPSPTVSKPTGTPQRYAPVTTGALPASASSITVQPGDTLYQLARRHGVSVAALRRANRLTSNIIRPGQTLMMPGAPVQRAAAPVQPRPYYQPVTNPPAQRAVAPKPRDRWARTPASNTPQQFTGAEVYTVRRGDSLYAISRRTGVSVAELKRLNGIADVRRIRPGARLALRRSVTPQRRAPVISRQPKPQYQVASRTNDKPRPLIQAKPIKTVPIERNKAAKSNGDATARQPYILNQRPNTPVTTKPEAKVAAIQQAAPEQKFRWPARGRVIANFNHSGQGVKNDGINIAVPLGSDIAAAESGVVAYAGSELKGYGNLVLLRHDNGWVSAYAHASQILVKRGDRIVRGQIIAKAGRSGEVSQPQVHFELRKGAKPVDPMPHLAAL